MNGTLLWIDDEIELLKAHIIFLEKKGYQVHTVSNGTDAIDICKKQSFDLILLDEMMPGLTGLETLQEIKEISPATPIVMVTKSEEEDIMDQAIGSKIADYLIKPVNPHQILLTLKKNIHEKEIVTEVTQTGYMQIYQQLAMDIADCKDMEGWKDIYKKLVHWELELSNTKSEMTEMLTMQKEEANIRFAKYIKNNYIEWVTEGNKDKPLMSPDVFKKKVFPILNKNEKVFFIVIDNFRYDQWKLLSKEIGKIFDIEEDMVMSILPTATQYARNAIFSGLMPNKIAELFPELWVDEDEDEGKNLKEHKLVQTLLDRFRRHETYSYQKINNSKETEKYLERVKTLQERHLNILVINFIDMLSHARTESQMVRELACDEAAYRSITMSWYKHSILSDLLKVLSESDFKVIITTDHGSIKTSKPVKIIGDKNTNTNLRYKIGKNLSYNSKDLFVIKNPKQAQLPAPNVSSSYVFATGDSFFAYPNNYNYYASYYKNTFQHGGISMEEMLVPIATLTPKKKNI